MCFVMCSLFVWPLQYDPLLKSAREKPWILIATALNFTHKIFCAVVFGVFGLMVGAQDGLTSDTSI